MDSKMKSRSFKEWCAEMQTELRKNNVIIIGHFYRLEDIWAAAVGPITTARSIMNHSNLNNPHEIKTND